MDADEKYRLTVKNTEEIITDQELRHLLETESKPHAYWGFECSGQ